jgi:hypothetical protein
MARYGTTGYLMDSFGNAKGSEDEKLSDLSEARLNKEVFHIIATKRRRDMTKRYEKVILGDQAGDDCLMFNTSFSDEIFAVVPAEVEDIMRSKKPTSAKFDALLFLTYFLNQFDTWMCDYEDSDGLNMLVRALSKAWTTLLQKSDAELEVDPEFTRPATEAMLTELKKKFKSQCYDKPNFNWK